MARHRLRKLTDQRVRQLRQFYAAVDPKPTWSVLGARFGVSGRTAYRLVTGQQRAAAGGPVAAAKDPRKADAAPKIVARRTALPLAGERPRRYAGCGSLVYMPCRLFEVRAQKIGQGSLPTRDAVVTLRIAS